MTQMNILHIIIAGALFLASGITFCVLSVVLKGPKPASKLFMTVGALTAVLGLMIIVMRSELTKLVIEVAGLIYLVLLIVSMAIFSAMVKGPKDERDDSQR